MPKARQNTLFAILLVCDFFSTAFAVAVALRLRFGFVREIPQVYLQNRGVFIIACLLINLGFSLFFSVYPRSLRPMTSSFAVRSAAAIGCTSAALLGLDRWLRLGVPFEIIIIFGAVLYFLTVMTRLVPAFGMLLYVRFMQRRLPEDFRPTAIYGAGELGRYLAEKLTRDPSERLAPVVFIDDNPGKVGTRIGGIRVAGGIQDLERIKNWHRIEQVVVAINNPDPQLLRQLMVSCRSLGLGLNKFGLSSGPADMSFAKLAEIAPEELLHRQSIKLDLGRVRSLIEGAVVLVTGGAGSIGSEICYQVLTFGAAKCVVFDISENSLFELDARLSQDFDPARYVTVVGSVRERPRLDQIFEQYRPKVVFHAAAHKHVPLMELNPQEAVKNNVFGTINTAYAAIKAGVERFILISTDKAVNPANVMGATKRVAELAIQLLDGRSKTGFCAVRFGNVLGSQGSVVPTFKRQIAAGGPVTVTHPDMVRYFMTIPEAVQLVLEAGAMAKGGEIFVLDMGEPVKIYDLACDLIRLSGLVPHKDIEIEFCGTRPGEKLFEEISLAEEDTTKTSNEKIFINRPVQTDLQQFKEQLRALHQSLQSTAPQPTLEALGRLVPTFQPAQEGEE